MKRVFAIGAALWLLLSAFTISVVAEGDPTLVLTDASGTPGETVTVVIRLDNNPGLISAKVSVGYDASALELVECVWGGFPSDGYSTGPLTNQPLVVNFCDGMATADYFTDRFATLRFRIKEDAVPDTYPLTMTCDFEGDFFNAAWEAVYFNLDQGSITVLPSATVGATTTTTADETDITVTHGGTVTMPSATRPTPTVITGSDTTDPTQSVTAPTATQTTAATKPIDVLDKISSFGSAGMLVPIIAAVIISCFCVILAICKRKK